MSCTDRNAACKCQAPELHLRFAEAEDESIVWCFQLVDPGLDDALYLYLTTSCAGELLSAGWDREDDAHPIADPPDHAGWPPVDPTERKVVLDRVAEELARANLARSLPALRRLRLAA